MLRPSAASRRATLALTAAQRIPRRQLPAIRRQISFIPWRRKPPQEAMPVYFPKSSLSPQPKSFRRRIGRAVFTGLVFYACWTIFATVVFDPLLDWADHEWESLSEKEKQEMDNLAEEGEPILFLPFPFTTKSVRQPPYKGTDPEWATFVAISKDTSLQTAIRNDLAERIRRAVQANQSYVQILGGKEIVIKKLWLDIIYPVSPPPKFYVSGLIIDDDGLFWGDRMIDPAALGSLNLAIYPKAVAFTAWAFASTLFTGTAADIGKALGIGKAPATWQSVTLERIEQKNHEHATKQSNTQPQQPASPVMFPSLPGDPMGTSGSEPTMHPRIAAATEEAYRTFLKSWQPAKPQPAKGCIRVDGLIELKGQSAMLAVYVFGWYDPKERRYTGIETRLKHLVPLKQKPAFRG